jgi:hypothetical protein
MLLDACSPKVLKSSVTKIHLTAVVKYIAQVQLPISLYSLTPILMFSSLKNLTERVIDTLFAYSTKIDFDTGGALNFY